jgi:hypothetical protein
LELFSSSDVARWCRNVNLPSKTRSALANIKATGKALLDKDLKQALLHAGLPLGEWHPLQDEIMRLQTLLQQAKQGMLLCAIHLVVVAYLCSHAIAAGRDPYLSTVGVQTERHSTGGLLSSGVTLQLVDFAGQPEYYVPHSLFLRQSSAVYVVVVPYCVPTVSIDPKASHTPLNQQHLAPTLPLSSPSLPSGGYVPNVSYRDELEYQLKSLCTTLPASAHVPVIVALTHIDVITNDNVHWMKPDLASLSKMKDDLNGVFSPGLEIVDVIAVDYSRDSADGSVASLGKRIISSATVIHERSFIPKHYQAAMRCIDSLAASSPSSVLPVSRLSDHVSVALQEFGEKQGSKLFASKSTKLLAATAKSSAKDQSAVDDVVRFMSGLGVILLDSRLDVCVCCILMIGWLVFWRCLWLRIVPLVH